MITEKDQDMIIYAVRCLPDLEYYDEDMKVEKITEEKAHELIQVVERLVEFYNSNSDTHLITKEKVNNLVHKYLGSKYKLSLTPVDDLNIYNASSFPTDAFYYHVSNPDEDRIGGGRIIGVNQKTGEIFYDGSGGKN